MVNQSHANRSSMQSKSVCFARDRTLVYDAAETWRSRRIQD